MGLSRVQQELHVELLSGHAVRTSCCIQAGGVQPGGGRCSIYQKETLGLLSD